MATLLKQYPVGQNMMWLDQLPEVGVATSDSSLEFTLMLPGNVEICRETLYSCKGVVRVDMLSLVDEYMLLHHLVYAALTFRFRDSAGAVSCYLDVVRRRTDTGISFIDWSLSRFLSLARGKVLPAGSSDLLTVYYQPYTSINAKDMTATVMAQYIDTDGSFKRMTATISAGEKNAVATVRSFPVAWPAECMSAGRRPVMMTVSLEGRVMTYYNTPEECAGIRFENTFGVPENIYSPVSVSQTLKTTASVARIRQARRTYDISTKQEVSLVFPPCDTVEYAFIRQLSESQEIQVWPRCTDMPGYMVAPTGGHRFVVESCDFNVDPETDSQIIPEVKCTPATPLPISLDYNTGGQSSGGIFTNQFTEQFS